MTNQPDHIVDMHEMVTATNQASEVLQGDCLELMKDIPDGSVDMILADLPSQKQQVCGIIDIWTKKQS